MTNRLFSNKTFQRLQKERESEEKKLEASRATLQEQQQQLEKEIADQKNVLDQVLSQVLGAKERARTLQQEERWGETLEKMRLLIFLPAILIPACASSSPAFLMMYSA